jgi:transcriptional regulator with XRE-family HTH domain
VVKYALPAEAVRVRADRQNVAKAFGQALRQSRERAGMSQEELAHLACVDRTFVSRAERGVCQPALATVLLLAGALKISAATLVGNTEKALELGP